MASTSEVVSAAYAIAGASTAPPTISMQGKETRVDEFGHVVLAGEGFRADFWGAGNYAIKADGKTYRFEDSDRFGPALVNERGEHLKQPYPGERSPFWRAHRIWRRQGRRTQNDGSTCIWDEPTPMIARRIVGRHHMVVDGGEEDGKTVFIDE